jgi:hypothetical protein
MRRLFLTLLLITFVNNLFAQKADKIIIRNTSVSTIENIPINDDSSLYPDKYGIYGESEHEPMFPGGDKSYQQFIKKNLIWPDKSGMIDVTGKVIISFVVERDGRLTNFKVNKKLYPTFDTASVNALKKSPRWHPGIVNGHKVRVRYSLQFNFQNLDE